MTPRQRVARYRAIQRATEAATFALAFALLAWILTSGTAA